MSSVAWATVALLLFLLPGFLFFAGIYVPEQFTREVARRSPLTQLAGSVLVALVLHGALYLSLQEALGIPDLQYILGAFQVRGTAEAIGPGELARVIEENRIAIFGYLVTTSLLGLGGGWATGCGVVRGVWPFRLLAQHGWVYKLIVDGADSFAFAYILTNIRVDGRWLMYRGSLVHFGLRTDGQFSYVVLSGAERTYMRLEPEQAIVDRNVHKIGSSAHSGSGVPGEVEDSYFVIEGEDIANIVFDRRTYTRTRKGELVLGQALKQLAEHLQKITGEATEEYAPAGGAPTDPTEQA